MSLGYTRKKIRESLSTVLNNISSIENRVVYGDESPSIGIPNITYSIRDDEDSNGSYMDAGAIPTERDIRIVVECRSLYTDDSGSTIDDLCVEVERELASGSTLNAWCDDLEYVSTEFESEESNEQLSLATLNYVGHYEAAKEVQILSVTKDVGSTTVGLSATTDIAGVITMVLMESGPSTHTTGTTIETSGTTHSASFSGLTPSALYFGYYYFVSEPIGMDVTTEFTWLSVDGTALFFPTLPA